jgi:hypothetical protein
VVAPEASRRDIKGIIGPNNLAHAARHALGFTRSGDFRLVLFG